MVDVMDEYTISSVLLEEVSSTNDWARANFLYFSSDITLVRALHQSSGRGLSGSWLSPSNRGIYSSYVTFLLPRMEVRLITFMAITSILQMLHEMGIWAQVKWPNDIMLNNKKIGGVLSEVVSCVEKTASIIGIGLNINTLQSDMDRIDQLVTSLYMETGSTYSVTEISNRLTYYIMKNCAQVLQSGVAPFHAFLQNRWFYFDEWIEVDTCTRSVVGKMTGVGLDGALQVQLASTEMVSIYSGKIVIPRKTKAQDLE